MYYIDENDFVRSIEFKDSLKNSCINVQLNLSGEKDLISTHETCFSQIFKKEFNYKKDANFYTIYNRTFLTEYYKNGTIEKRQFIFPNVISISNIYTIIYTQGGLKSEIYYSYIDNKKEYKNGLFMKFHCNGNIFIKGLYSNDKPIEIFEIFDEEGIKLYDIDFNTCKNCKLPE